MSHTPTETLHHQLVYEFVRNDLTIHEIGKDEATLTKHVTCLNYISSTTGDKENYILLGFLTTLNIKELH